MKKTLHLTLKKKWFDLILAGEKKEEYREIKPYWIKRLTKSDGSDENEQEKLISGINNIGHSDFYGRKHLPSFCFPKHFDTIAFRNGYASNAPTMIVELQSIQIELGLSSWGAQLGKKYFVLYLGNILHTENLNHGAAR